MISRLILIAASSRLQIHLDAADIVVARQGRWNSDPGSFALSAGDYRSAQICCNSGAITPVRRRRDIHTAIVR
jgi:hypothetical protein